MFVSNSPCKTEDNLRIENRDATLFLAYYGLPLYDFP